MASETLANGILGLVNWGITIIVIMLIWEFFKLLRGGKVLSAKDLGQATGDVGRGLKDFGRALVGEEKKAEQFSLREFAELKQLRKEIENAEDEKDLKRISDRRATRAENKAYRRVERLEEDLEKAKEKLPPGAVGRADKVLEEMKVFNNLVLEKVKEIDDALGKDSKDFAKKREVLLKLVLEAMGAESKLFAVFEEFKKQFI